MKSADWKMLAVIAVTIIALLFAYKILFIRTVNYEIAGIKIPSKYNLLTGNIKPIPNYKGTAKIRTVEQFKSNKIGLSGEQVVLAKLRWAVFEQWADSRDEYKGWREDAEKFKKANDEFRNEILKVKK